MRFDQRVCIVTGAGSGIGRATTLLMAKEGAKITVVDVSEGPGNETVKLIQQAGGEAIFAKADVGSPNDIRAAVDATLKEFGRIDVVVNNAAMMIFKDVVDLEEEEWEHVLNVNLRSVFLFCKYALPHINNGAVVNVSSVHAHETTAQCSAYAASKGGIEAFTRALSREIPIEKARVNCVAPGAVDTPMLWNNPNVKSGREKVEGNIGKPINLAQAICFLASDQAAFVHGTTLVVDGGRLDIL